MIETQTGGPGAADPSDRWEAGSVFHASLAMGRRERWPSGSQLHGSGRAALRSLLTHLSLHGVQRVWVPTLYCHEVTEAIADLVAVAFYDHGPGTDQAMEVGNGDAVVVPEYFGARARVRVQGGVLIVDRSHDPTASWAYEREPDYVFASLRKALPVPDGGALWSRSGLQLDSVPDLHPQLAEASSRMLAGMMLKAAYLAGREVTKDEYLPLVRQAETQIAAVRTSCASPYTTATVRHLATSERRLARRRNREHLANLLTGSRGVEQVEGESYLVLKTGNADEAAAIQAALVRRRVYPAVLWPSHPTGPEPAHPLTGRLLALHVDARYSDRDMDLVAQHVQAGLREVYGA